MKKGLTELVFILDRSGSMGGLESDTIGGFNSMIDKQRREPGEVLVTTVLFDDKYEVIHDRFRMEMIHPLTDKDYYARGCTALLDAIGGAVHHIGNVHKYARDEDRPEHTVFVITTDGEENSSREYSYEKIKKMVKRQQEKYGWEFIFLGANMDAIGEAGKLGIRSDRAVRYECDGAGTILNYSVLSETVGKLRCCEAVAADWSKDITDHYNKKNRK